MEGPQRIGRGSPRESLNASVTNESISEMKKETAIPVLKNTAERFINRPDRGVGRGVSLFNNPQQIQSFSVRVGSTDPYSVAA